MNLLRLSNDRGRVNLGWLDSRHSFSFGGYYDPNHMGVSVLRVINDDVVKPSAGFDTHGHHDMEILSYILSGTIEHKDSMGNKKQIAAGEFQLMSAGTGIQHSEYNASQTEPLHLLQIWLQPNRTAVEPRYDQKSFDKHQGLTAIVHPTAEGAMRAHTDASVYRYQGEDVAELDADGSQVYVHVVSGEVIIDDKTLQAGDGYTVHSKQLSMKANKASEALVFDLP